MKKKEVRAELVTAIVKLEELKKELPLRTSPNFYGALQGAYRAIQLDEKKEVMKDYLKLLTVWAKSFEDNPSKARKVSTKAWVEEVADKHITPNTSGDAPLQEPLGDSYSDMVKDIEDVLAHPTKLLTLPEEENLFNFRCRVEEGKPINVSLRLLCSIFLDKAMKKKRELNSENPVPSEEHLLNKLSGIMAEKADPAKSYLALLLLEDLRANEDNFELAETVYRNTLWSYQ